MIPDADQPPINGSDAGLSAFGLRPKSELRFPVFG